VIGYLLVWVRALVGVVLFVSAGSKSIGVIIRRGMSVPCRCFGASSRSVGAAHLTRNLALAALAAAAAVAVAVYRGTGLSPEPPEIWLALLSGAAVAAVIIRLDDILPQ
jgi:hypothetical protein